jgi:hypothetical protein
MMGRFLNTAHRSTYWTQHLTALAASTANAVPLEGRIFPSYPHYLRRSAPAGRGSIVEKLAELCGTNKAITREEFLHPLFALTQDDSLIGDSTRFDVSLELGLSPEEHLSLAGLTKTRRSSKALVKAYEEAMEARRLTMAQQAPSENTEATLPRNEHAPPQNVEDRPPGEDEPDSQSGQSTLF